MTATTALVPAGNTGPGNAFRRLFWDMITDAGAPAHTQPHAEEVPVDTARTAVVIEDESDIRALISQVLERAGFIVYTAADGAAGLELVREHEPLVTTLDISMPGIDGFEVAKRIRQISSTYLVMLTARADEIDTLQGLQAGADDYLTKPFRPRELRARVEAMMRRPRHLGAAVTASEEDSWAEHGELRLHPASRIARLDGEDLDLTRSEFDILAALLKAGRGVTSKTDLVRMLRGERDRDSYVSGHDLRAVEVHMANLRRKLGESAANPRWIETIRGVGYRLSGN